LSAVPSPDAANDCGSRISAVKENRPAPPLVIPVFIPHEGCPHSCLFCNQQRISGVTSPPVGTSEVTEIISTWISRPGKRRRSRVQVAFYGGSFTCLETGRQRELLDGVSPFIEAGDVQEIRLSTRPDYITGKGVAFLHRHHVRIVELGVQSLDNYVLGKSLRGHSAEDAIRSSELLKKEGMELGLQLMVGLPGQNFASLRRTIEQVTRLRPDFVRIYPVLVVAGSGLAHLYRRGEYRPLSPARAVLQVAWMKKKLMAAGIRVVRMGLQPGPELEKSLLAGPYHPAFGELVNSRLMLQQVRQLLAGVGEKSMAVLSIAERDLSVFQGMRRANIERLTSLGLSDRFILQTDPGQCRGTVKLIEIKKKSGATG